MATYEATGTLHQLNDTITYDSGFKKREFVIETEDGKYPQQLKFEVVKDNCDKIGNWRDGQKITVHFDIRGNEYKEKYYVNLLCWRWETDEHDQTQEPQRAHKQDGHQMPDASKLSTEDDDNSIPF